jgi:hypothetical protein
MPAACVFIIKDWLASDSLRSHHCIHYRDLIIKNSSDNIFGKHLTVKSFSYGRFKICQEGGLSKADDVDRIRYGVTSTKTAQLSKNATMKLAALMSETHLLDNLYLERVYCPVYIYSESCKLGHWQ